MEFARCTSTNRARARGMRLRADSGRFAARAWRIGTVGETRCSTMVRCSRSRSHQRMADFAREVQRVLRVLRCPSSAAERRIARPEHTPGRALHRGVLRDLGPRLTTAADAHPRETDAGDYSNKNPVHGNPPTESLDVSQARCLPSPRAAPCRSARSRRAAPAKVAIGLAEPSADYRTVGGGRRWWVACS